MYIYIYDRSLFVIMFMLAGHSVCLSSLAPHSCFDCLCPTQSWPRLAPQCGAPRGAAPYFQAHTQCGGWPCMGPWPLLSEPRDLVCRCKIQEKLANNDKKSI